MYKVGDKVVYPMHGAGEIVGLEEKEIFGQVKEYYILNMPIGGMKVSLPVDSIDKIGVRDIISEKEADQLLDDFSNYECDETTNWNKRYRENMEKIKSGSVTSVAYVVKALMLRDKDKGLSTGERKMLSSAKQILLSELILAKDISADKAEMLISERVGDN
ncbi:MAG: CarD family transcriptional regulator [Clostridia bacterium]|nr:CarD family transcriptional regulator [Clostridia bacterium]